MLWRPTSKGRGLFKTIPSLSHVFWNQRLTGAAWPFRTHTLQTTPHMCHDPFKLWSKFRKRLRESFLVFSQPLDQTYETGWDIVHFLWDWKRAFSHPFDNKIYHITMLRIRGAYSIPISPSMRKGSIHSVALYRIATQNFVTSRTLFLRRCLRGG